MGMRLSVKVIPKSSQEKIVEIAPGELKIYVHAAPQDGLANKSVKRLVAEKYNIAPSAVTIIKGETSRLKSVEIK